MAEIHRMKKEGETIFPATTTDAVVHPQLKTTVSSLVVEYNVSALFPTSGQDSGNKYTLSSMIAILGSKLTESQKIAGVKGSFLDVTSGELLTYEFNGKTSFSDSSGWGRVDSGFINELSKKIITPRIDGNTLIFD